MQRNVASVGSGAALLRRPGAGGVAAVLACLLTLPGITLAGSAAPPAPPERPAVAAPGPAATLATEVSRLLQQRCLGCHGVGARLSGLDLRTRAAALKGGLKGAALVPGNPRASLLFQAVSGSRLPAMPPADPLRPGEIALLMRWIQQGAPWPGEPIEQAAPQVWWSFRPPQPPRVPEFSRNRRPLPGRSASGRRRSVGPGDRFDAAAWVRNPIDAFVLQRLLRQGMLPSPPASRRVLLRRAALDLTGLPPSPEEVRAFEADRSPDAWAKVVDRLLASPDYGERWGRHWLDLVRYADSSGFEGDQDRPLAWKYRDYVIAAFNADTPYDRFVCEQLAGDEVRPEDPQAWIATGFLACGPEDFAMAKLPMTRADELDDLVSTTGSVVLGLTVGCARCHDHKYDPIRQLDYYRMQALFAPTERREVDVPTPEERRVSEARALELEPELAPLRAQVEPLRRQGMAAAMAGGQARPTEEQVLAALPEAERKQLASLQAQVRTVEARRIPLPRASAVTDRSRDPEPVHLLIRGDANQKGPVVTPGFIAALPGGSADVGPEAATTRTTGRRRALAGWLTSPQNPLTARVWMNRVWRQHFGRGLVNTPSNFGINGELPSHPELLDWLALEFMRGEPAGGSAAAAGSGPWSLKRMQRLMLLSSTYGQSSAADSAGLVRDPQNLWCGRMPARRLEAEAIRDSILLVAGSLNREIGGPPVYPPVDPSLRSDGFGGPNWPEGEDSPRTWRRSVYVKVKRSLVLPQLEAFDCPEGSASVAQRNVTTTPTQALMLLNDPLIRKQAARFAGRVRSEAGNDPRRQVTVLTQLAFQRDPAPRELAAELAFLALPVENGAPSRLVDLCQAVFNLNEFVYVQ